MDRLLRHQNCCRWLLAAVLLASNVGAPLRTAGPVRLFLNCLGRHAATHSVLRVRVVSQVGSAHGFRAVVGLAKGGPDESVAWSNSRPLPGLFSVLSTTTLSKPVCLPVLKTFPPLRC
jgi:hypothetical protein